MKAQCGVCFHGCVLEEGGRGLCGARVNRGGEVICENYGQVTALALDPIEKKPLRRFFPGSKILSAGSYGCNLRCPFCQNYDISMAGPGELETVYIAPEVLVEKALELVPRGNIGVAYTYNEPAVGFEYVLDCSRLARSRGLKNVMVTNGTVCEGPLGELLGCVDAMNIDLKGFTEAFYRKLGGDLGTVKRTIVAAAEKCHVEVTTLVIPGENDGGDEMRELSAWLASVDPGIPLHVSRFFPRYRMDSREPTPVGTIGRLAEIARGRLRHVYTGNC